MNAYEGLAGAYDALTGDVGYEKRADYLEKLFARSRIPVRRQTPRFTLRCFSRATPLWVWICLRAVT